MSTEEPVELTEAAKRRIEIHVRRQLVPLGAFLVGLSAVLGGLVTWGLSSWAELAVHKHEKAFLQEANQLAKQFVGEANKLARDMGEKAEQAEVEAQVATKVIGLIRARAAAAEMEIDNAEKRARALEERSEKLIQTLEESGSKEIAEALLKTDLKQQIISEATSRLAPIGSVMAWPVDSLPSDNWKVCAGQYLPTKDYPLLARVLGPSYGAGRPSMVKLPNFQGRFLRGAGQACQTDGQPIAGVEAKPIGTPQEFAVGQHQHGAGRLVTLADFQADSLMWVPTDGLDKYVDDASLRKSKKSAGLAKPQKLDTSDMHHGIRVSGKTGDIQVTTGESRPSNYAVQWIIRVK